MGKKKKKKKKKDSSKKTIQALIAMCAFLTAIAFYSYLSEDSERSTIQGSFDSYEENNRRFDNNRLTNYYIYVDGEKYTIPRIYISAFKKDRFLTDVETGDLLTLTIQDGKSIYQVTKDNRDYIDISQLEEEVEGNRFAGLIVGLFFLVGLFYLINLYQKL